MNGKIWLLSDDDFYDRDWLMEFLPEVGVFCSGYSKSMFEVIRFEESPHTDCPKCGNLSDNYDLGKQWKCKKCHHKYSIISGTYLQNTKIDFCYWFRMAYLLGGLKVPINSCWISRDLKLTQKTVYYMLTTIKRALQIDVNGINFKLPYSVDDYKIIDSLLKLRV